MSSSFAGITPKSHDASLVRDGRPEGAIVVGNNAGSFDHFVAEELQRYLKLLSGATLPIISADGVGLQEKGKSLLLVGGPESNEMVRKAAARGLVDFNGLKKDGYILRTISFNGKSALVLGGSDEAGTMYAAYDLLHRLGFVFLLTKDIVPERRTDVPLPRLREQINPAFRLRGLHVDNCYSNQTLWSLNYWKRILDQMAKMRMNYLQFYWFPYAPWLTYEYKGEKNFMGDVSNKNSGYLLWQHDFGSHLTKDIVVGKQYFKYARLAPPEFQDVQTPDEAFKTAQDMLRGIIAYAKTRKIAVWLAIDPTSLPANLARYARNQTGARPFHPIMGGDYMCPQDPVVDQINENRLKSLISTYPGAAGYFFWLPELYPVCEDKVSQDFYLQERPKYYAQEVENWKYYSGYERSPERVVDSNSGGIYLIQQLKEARDRINPKIKIGIGAFGRGYLYPQLDQIFPKGIPFTDMVSRAIWTPTGVPMYQYKSTHGREEILIARSDDDSDMLGMQFNVNMYYKDRMFEGALENGVVGETMQVNRARGMEQNESYLAEGWWNPHLTPQEFYAEYLTAIYGQTAAPKLMRAYQTLEQNEEYLGWTGQGNFGCCGPLPEIGIIREYSEQADPYD
ncbi:MAG: alpha-glucuronidase family glycosyl hydrolase, partial [Rhabdochlamydiaceae bacterium]